MWRTGLEPPPLRGWVGGALSLATNDVVLNALGRARFCEVWWASLTLRGAAYAVLTGAPSPGSSGPAGTPRCRACAPY